MSNLAPLNLRRAPIGKTEDGKPVYATPEFIRYLEAMQREVNALRDEVDALP